MSELSSIDLPSFTRTVRVTDDSMSPTLPIGSYLTAEKVKGFALDDIYLLEWQGVLQVRRIQHLKNEMAIICDNKHHKTFHILPSVFREIKVFARVTGVISDIRKEQEEPLFIAHNESTMPDNTMHPTIKKNQLIITKPTNFLVSDHIYIYTRFGIEYIKHITKLNDQDCMLHDNDGYKRVMAISDITISARVIGVVNEL